METNTRVLVNTISQYIKTFLSGLLTLYSSRVILRSLGDEDYGIYALIAGIVMMLSFMTNALSSTTQRFISYYQGEDNYYKVRIVFCNSFYLHLLLGFVLGLVSTGLVPFLFNGFLNIPLTRLSDARLVYYAVVFTLFLSFVSSPFRAVLIANENIVFISIIDVLDAVLKLVIALSLPYIVLHSRLVYFGWMLLLIQFFNLIVFSTFCFFKYANCLAMSIKALNKEYLSRISNFAGWNIYTLLCTLGRTQGIAVLLNRVMGPIVNTAYGLGLQLSSYANYMSESILNAMRPQIVKSEGARDRTRTFHWSCKACKYCFSLLSLVSIPSIFEMPSLLHIWLGQYPQNAIVFGRMFLLAGVVDSLSIGLHVANQAIGSIKAFTLRINTLKFFTLFIAFFCLNHGYSVITVAVVYVVIELLCALWRIAILRKDGLNVGEFISEILCRALIPCFFSVVACLFVINVCSSSYRILITYMFSSFVFFITFYLWGLDIYEKERIKCFACSLFSIKRTD